MVVTVFFGKELITKAAKYIVASASTTEDGNFEYEVLEDGTIEITNYLGEEANVTIPETIEGKKVTSIGEVAFGYCISLRYIKIPNGVERIEDWAFESCINLRSIEIPESVTSIGDGAFVACLNLKSIDVDSDNAKFMSENGVVFNKEKTKIIQYPAGKQNVKYIIPESVTNIGFGAFAYCMNLYNVEIPETVTYIEEGAFYSCTSLSSIKVLQSVTNIDGYAFGYCTNLKSIEIPENVTNILDDNSFCRSKIIMAIDIENGTTQEIELPDIIKRALDENDILYSSNGFDFTNCELNEDETRLVVNTEKVKEENASLYVNDGVLEGLSFEIVPSGTITYSKDETYFEWWPFKTNVVAILHLAEGEQVINNNGENTHIFTRNGEFTFEYTDVNGNIKTSKAVVDWMWEFSVEGEYITDIQSKTTVNELKADLLMKVEDTEGIDVKVYDKEKEEVAEDEFVGTGMQIELTNGTDTETYTLVVRGDTNGDGKADFKDLTKVNSHRLNKNSLENEDLLSADVNDDGIVDFKDLVKINQFRLSKITEL